jgi:hypothetical protein
MTTPQQAGSAGQGESDLAFEREKLKAALIRQDRELDIKERDIDLRDREARRSRWSNRLVLAVVGATLAALGNAGVTYFSGISQREIETTKADKQHELEVTKAADARKLEEQTAESQRILEMIKTDSDPDKAADNLRFLLETKLVSEDKRAAIATYLGSRKKGEGAALPASAGGRGEVCAGKPRGTACGQVLGSKGGLAFACDGYGGCTVFVE